RARSPSRRMPTISRRKPTSTTNTSALIPADAEGGTALLTSGLAADLRSGYWPTGLHEALFHDIVIMVLLPVDRACRTPQRVAGVTVAQSSDQLKRPGS